MTLRPSSSLLLALDGDLKSSPTLFPGVKSQAIGLGAEQSLLSQSLFLRLGALKNLADRHSLITPTAGLGLSIGALRLDAGGGYDFQGRQALASLSLGMTF